MPRGRPGPGTAPDVWVGGVLCGGASRRMGRDKCLIVLEGRPLARRVADALRSAGARRVVAVGGDGEALARAGLAVVADGWPGGGPLGGLVTALRWAARDHPGATVAVVVACDLLAPSGAAFGRLVAALPADPGAAVAVPLVDGRRQWAHAAWRIAAADALAGQFAVGERAIHRAVAGAGLTAVDVTGLDPAALADADVPADLPAPEA